MSRGLETRSHFSTSSLGICTPSTPPRIPLLFFSFSSSPPIPHIHLLFHLVNWPFLQLFALLAPPPPDQFLLDLSSLLVVPPLLPFSFHPFHMIFVSSFPPSSLFFSYLIFFSFLVSLALLILSSFSLSPNHFRPSSPSFLSSTCSSIYYILPLSLYFTF